MIIKEKFDLIVDSAGHNTYNILPVRSHSLYGSTVDDNDLRYLTGQVSAYVRSRKTVTSDIINKYIKDCLVVRLPEYPLPGTVTADFKPVINLSYLSDVYVSDYNSADIYSMFLYSISLAQFMKHRPFPDNSEEIISAFIFQIFMVLFAKQSGLTGSYKDLIPALRLLIALYVHVNMYGKQADTSSVTKFASAFYMDPTKVNLNFDFSSTIDFLHSINKNRIISISENKFSTEIIKKAGMTSLPLFEDVSRFFATILASDVSGNSIFSHFFAKRNVSFFEKLYGMGLTILNRVS